MQNILTLNQEYFFKIFQLSGQNKIFDNLMIFSAVYLIFLTLFISIVFSILGGVKEKKSLLLCMLSFGVGFILLKTLGFLLYEPRPFTSFQITPIIGFAPGDAFPSDHTTILTILALSYSAYKSKLTWFLISVLFLVGFSRIYTGVHYPVDILGGIIFGTVSVYISWKIKGSLMKKILSS